MVNASLLRELRLHVSALGGCPTNRSNIQMPDDEVDDEWVQFLSADDASICFFVFEIGFSRHDTYSDFVL